MKASKGNKSDAAWRLGIQRRSLYEKLTQFGML
jgi:DNA-binding protein Fis